MSLCPLLASGRWAGLSVGPSFDVYSMKPRKLAVSAPDINETTKFPSDLVSRSSALTDFGLDITASGAYYFDDNESLGIGLNIGVGIFFNKSKVEGQMLSGNPFAGTDINLSASFQYRLALADKFDLRLGAGLGYTYTFSKGSEAIFLILGDGKLPEGIKIKEGSHTVSFTASADVSYSFGDFAVFGGLALDIPFYNSIYLKVSDEKVKYTLNPGLLGVDISPRIGASYSF